MIRSSINIIPEGAIADAVALARTAERLGFDRCWVYDEGLAARDVYVTMTAIAAATTTLQLGTGITNPYTRHPAQTASAIASLDEVSGGRAFLGIGAGGSLALDPMGIERTRPLTAVRETIEICRSLFSGGPVDFEGAHASLTSSSLDYGRPEIEIWLAGRGPKMLHLGGASADGVMLDFIHRDHIADYVGLVKAGAETTGRSAQICYSTAIVSDEDDLEFVRPHMTYRLIDSPQPVKDQLGISGGDVERIRSAMAGGLHAAAEHVRDEWILPFIISGSTQVCANQLGSLVDQHGFNEFLLPMFEMPDPSEYLKRVAAVVEKVR
ncbi:MAG: LLM class flavin-dependent oxidoreductase [Acidimicrobiales bacterium]